MPSDYKRTRLDRIAEQKGYKKLIASVVAGIAAVIMLLYFGVPLLISMSTFISSMNNNNREPVKTTEVSIIMPPSLDPITEATNSSPIVITGIADAKTTVELFINDNLIDSTDASTDGKFKFTGVDLKQGSNSIYAVIVSNDKKSDKSEVLNTLFKKTPPKLEVTKPENDAKVTGDKKEAEIAGNTDPGINITINDHFIVVSSDGSFNYIYPLNDGDNILKIVATDTAGNQTTIDKKVNYSSS